MGIRVRSIWGPVFVASDGYLWASVTNGIIRVPLSAAAAGIIDTTDRIGVERGMSGPFAASMLEDREGNIWVGTSGGLDRFRKPKLTAVVFPKPLASIGIAAADSGSILAISTFGDIERVRPRSIDLLVKGFGAQSIFRTTGGAMWVAGTNVLLHASNDHDFTSVPLPHEMRDLAVQAVSEDAAGTIWLASPRLGLFRRDGGTWSLDKELGGSSPIVMFPARDSRMWFGYPKNRVSVRASGAITSYGPDDGLRVGNVLAIGEHSSTVWIGGETGVMWLDHGKFHMLSGKSGAQFHGVSGLVIRQNGDLWLNGSDGITRVPAKEVSRAVGDTTYRVDFERFDALDGLDGVPTKVRPLPTAIEGTDGRLWFVQSTGVFSLDPTALKRNVVAPPVYITSLVAGDSSYAVTDTIQLPARTTALQVLFTAPSLAMPERVHFRHRLDNLDTAWTDAGAHREAFYTNLKPGTYRFRVSAANEDGVWNEVGAAQMVRIAPTFTQTRLFKFIVTLAVLCALWAAYLLRLRAVAAGIRARYDARLVERTRIAEELHDTLLQGFTGITLQLQGIKQRLTAQSAGAGDELSRILMTADATLREARHAVWDIRGPDLDTSTLPAAVQTAMRECLLGSSIDPTFVVNGEYRRLPAAIEHTFLRIVREAVINAVRHAAAQHLDIELRYTPSEVTLSVCDDGDGIDVDSVATASSHGHWGIVGMRDRAARAGGRLDVRRRAERGSEIVVTIPG